MGSDSQCRIPAIELLINSVGFERGTDDWHHLSKSVREACENYGCFEIVYDKIPLQLRAETFSVIKELFSLPLEANQKNINPKPYHGYFGQYASIPLYESLGLEDSSNYDSLKSFTELMWPSGPDQFWHRVMMSGEKDRYSLGAFAVPVEGTIIKAPKELVDEEYPQILKEFDYMDFSKFSYSEEGRAIDSARQVFVFAGIST